MARERIAKALLLSMLLAFALRLAPWPSLVQAWIPHWIAMVLIYWLMFAPERIGIGFAFVLGLLQDIVFGDLLGQSALSMVIMAWIVSRFRLRLRFFPLWQQSLFVGGVLLNDKVVRIWVNGLTGSDFPGWLYWASPVSAIILWPFLFLLLDYLQYKRT